MQVEANDSNEKVKGDSVSLYAGLATVSVVAVNPTKAELHKLGLTYVDKEPKYTIDPKPEDEEAITKYRISFLLKAEKAENPALEKTEIFQVSFIVAPVQGKSKSGKLLWINELGKTVFAESKDDMPEWFKYKTLNPAFSGENTVLDFIRVWANVAKNAACAFDDRPGVSTGKVKEIDALIPKIKNNRLVVLLGITSRNDKHYSEVYSRFFGNTYTTLTQWKTTLATEYGKFNAVYPPSLTLTLMDAEEYSEPQVENAPGLPSFVKGGNSSAKPAPLSANVSDDEINEFLNGQTPAPNIVGKSKALQGNSFFNTEDDKEPF